MKITIESTTEIVTLNGVQCRVWEGQTEAGVKVQALIHKEQDLSQFDRELQEMRAPTGERAFPLRMIL